MANLRAIRKRISSVKSTQQITRAMKMVSAAKLRRAQDGINAARRTPARCARWSRRSPGGRGPKRIPC